ncbi:MAG: hypothetical protein ACTS5Y_02505 [Pollutimonas bauzanensis]|uniref:MxaK protein n=1 Tax=Pollutimonas bauzanensis TaxID=658167 RepID=A0A1M5M710_9BURK|nr:hypothetical protein [Pollutimonas bauzanensis]SHG73066.1 mxaK protein [Pollutimonas bauzanensis]
MPDLSFHRSRDAGAVRGRHRRQAWRHWLLWPALAAALIGAALSAAQWYRIGADNRAIQALSQGDDLAVALDAAPGVAFARLNFLLERYQLDEALPWAEALARADLPGPGARETPPLAALALYNMGNARLRHALDMIDRNRIGEAPASIRVAKDYYTRALRLAPDYWDARYNLDLASRMVRDLPRGAAQEEDDAPDSPKRLWTDLPGLPKGLP